MVLLKMADLKAKGIDYSKAHLWRMIREGKFPKPVKLGPRRVAFVDSEIDNWLDARIAERNAKLKAEREAKCEVA